MKTDYFNEVQDSLEKLKEAVTELDFESTKEPFDSNILSKNKEPGDYIYIVYFSDKANVSEILKSIEEAKRKFSKESDEKINFPKTNCYEGSKALYVGKSGTDLNKRLKEHLCKDYNKTTYGLHLCAWWNYEKFGDLEISIQKVSNITKNFSINALTLLEDAVSYEYKPLLGRRGDSPKAS